MSSPRDRSRSPRRDDGTAEGRKLYIANLSFNTDETALRDAFSRFGEVTDVQVVTDRETSRSKGFGFITFADANDATDARDKLNNSDIDGREIRIDFARPRAEGGRSFGGSSRGGRGGGGGGFRGDRDGGFRGGRGGSGGFRGGRGGSSGGYSRDGGSSGGYSSRDGGSSGGYSRDSSSSRDGGYGGGARRERY